MKKSINKIILLFIFFFIFPFVAKAGTANITIKYSGCNLKGDYEYLPSNITITVNVIRTQTNIELIYEVDSLNVSDSGSFIASVRPGLASGGVTYACNDTQVLRVDSNGYYKALSSGVALVTVTYAGNANYEPSQLNFTVKVNRKPTSIDDNDIDWIEEGDPKLSEEQLANRGKYIAKLDVANALPAQNLSQAEIFTFKKILGGGYSAALGGDFEAVENAIQEAQKYRDDRNKERSRLMLIAGAVVITIIIGLLYAWYYLTTEHPHFNMLTCMLMGAVGACVSTWLNNRKFDFTGQGLPILHYLEATMRIMMGVVFAFIVYMGMKSGMILTVFVPHASVYMYCILGFLAGFCETFVPSLLESFVNISKE